MNTPTFIQDNFRKNDKFNGDSRLVLGTSGLGGVWDPVNEQESVEAILFALEHGVEVIDTAPSYNKAEKYVGKALRKWSGKRPFISTKIGRLPAQEPDEVYLDYSPEGMRNSMQQSLELLGVEYVDLLFLHEPQLVPTEKMDSILETLQSFQEEGVVGMLGIGGNPDGAFWPYVKKEHFDVVSTFLKMDACTLEGFAHDIIKYQEEGLAVYAASSLHMGLLGAKYKKFVEDPPNNEWITQTHVENAVKINKIARQNEMTLTNLALRYLFSMKEADRVVLGPKNMDEVKKSISIWEEGPLDQQTFEEVTEVLMKSLD
jgi:aryl-alcohol dehydrogenase-like predicted oxidoreductase